MSQLGAEVSAANVLPVGTRRTVKDNRKLTGDPPPTPKPEKHKHDLQPSGDTPLPKHQPQDLASRMDQEAEPSSFKDLEVKMAAASTQDTPVQEPPLDATQTMLKKNLDGQTKMEKKWESDLGELKVTLRAETATMITIAITPVVKDVHDIKKSQSKMQSDIQELKSHDDDLHESAMPEKYRKMLERTAKEAADKRCCIRGWNPDTSRDARETQITTMMNAIDNNLAKFIEDGRINLINCTVKKDGVRVMTNLSFVDFPSKKLRNKFIAGTKGKNYKDSDKPLKFQNGLTDSEMERNGPLYKAMSKIEKSVESYTKEDIKIVWDERRLEYKGKGNTVWVQNERNNDGVWQGRFAHFNDDMDF